MWNTVWYGDTDFDKDRLALETLLVAVLLEMHSSLTDKETAKAA